MGRKTVMVMAMLALVLALAAPSGAGSGANGGGDPAAPAITAPTSDTFDALTYNVAGLPAGISGSEPDINTPYISPLLNDYDLVLVQEDWANPPTGPIGELSLYHHLLIADVTHPYLSEPMPIPLGSDPRRPSALVSDGLNRLSRFPFGEITREMWPNCFGGADTSDGGAGDCLSLKGFSVARTEFAPGVVIDVYNLHAEAGGSPLDIQYSAEDYEVLAAFIGTYSDGRPIIVGGDYNLHTDEPGDGAVFDQFLDETGATDVCEVVDCGADADRIDKFVFRSGGNIEVEPLSHEFEVDKFVRPTDGEPLSDHDALAVTFEWSLVPAFSDVPTDQPFFGEIAWMANVGLSEGFDDGTFRPQATAPRQETAAFVHGLAEDLDLAGAAEAPECTTAPFPDVPADHPFCREIAWMVDTGIAKGFDDGTFGPTAPVDRQSVAAFLHRLIVDDPEPTCDPGPFPDVPADHPFCTEIAWMADAGIAKGEPNGEFQPGTSVARQALAAFLYRAQFATLT